MENNFNVSMESVNSSYEVFSSDEQTSSDDDYNKKKQAILSLKDKLCSPQKKPNVKELKKKALMPIPTTRSPKRSL